MTTAPSPNRVVEAAKLLWPNLPMLLTGSILVTIGWAVVRQLAAWAPWLSLIGIGLLVVPTIAVLLQACTALLADMHFGVGSLFRALGRSFGRALRITIVPTLCAVFTMAAVSAWQVKGDLWMLASVGICATVSLVALYVGVIALPYAVRTGDRPRDAWLVSVYIATRNPIPVLAVLSAAALAVRSASYLSVALIILLPGPLALTWSAAVAVATDRSRERLSSYTEPGR